MASFERRIGWTALVGLGLGLGLNGWLSITPAAAQPSQEQQSAIRSNCRSDYMSNCSSVKPGGVEALQCLQRNAAKLSPGCRNAVNAVNPPPAPPQQQATTAPAAAPAAQPPAAAGASPALPAAAPAAPAAAPSSAPVRAPQQPVRAATAPAAAAPPGAARPTSQQQASAPMLASAPSPEQQNAIKFTCRRDFMTNCRNVTPGGPEALACLQRNAARLSPDCRTSLAAVADGTPAPEAAATPAAAAPAARPGPVGPLRRAIREQMMKR
jgi:hypothetical protein